MLRKKAVEGQFLAFFSKERKAMLHDGCGGFGQTSGEGGEIVEVDEDKGAIFSKDGITSIDGKA